MRCAKQKDIAIVRDDGVDKLVLVEIRTLRFSFLRRDDVRNSEKREQFLDVSVHLIRDVFGTFLGLTNLMLQTLLLFLCFAN